MRSSPALRRFYRRRRLGRATRAPSGPPPGEGGGVRMRMQRSGARQASGNSRRRAAPGGRSCAGRRGAALAAALLLLLPAAGARAALIASNEVVVTTAAGTISLVSRVHDEADGDASRWLFEYELTGDYQPEPGVTNGISSLQILFAGLVSSVADHTAPPGWLVDCCLTGAPFGAGFDLPNSAGFGVGPNGGAIFSFSVPAGTPYTYVPSGSFAGSHLLDVPV